MVGVASLARRRRRSAADMSASDESDFLMSRPYRMSGLAVAAYANNIHTGYKIIQK